MTSTSDSSLSHDDSEDGPTDGHAAPEDAIKAASLDLGFNLCGIAPAVSPTGYARLIEWLQHGYEATMSWMPGRIDAYRHPDGVFPGTKSVIAVAMNYRSGDPDTDEPRIARYAAGSRDYHDVLRERLHKLANVVQQQVPGCRTRCVVDTAPLLERDFAMLAGLGWFGKNTMLISPKIGSWCFLGAILTNAELKADRPFESDHCGTCTRCLEACPTDAFPEPHVLDASRCISYLTIEHRQQPIDPELRPGMGAWVFGCDVCQDVCPWNRFAPESEEPAFQTARRLTDDECLRLLTLSTDEFRVQFRDTPLFRTGRDAMLRNVAIVLGNRGVPSAVPVLIECLTDTSSLVRGAAAWAIGEIGGKTGVAALGARLEIEMDAEVREELAAALKRVQATIC